MSSFDPRYREAHVPGNLSVTLYRISQAIVTLLREKGRQHGLTATQLQTLLFLAYSRPGVRTIGGLAQRLSCTPATASGVANGLERKGLVTRTPWPQHRRTITLTLTRKGAALAAQVDNSLDELETIVRQLDHRDQENLLQGAQNILRGLADQGRVTIYEMCRNCAYLQPNVDPDNTAGPYRCAFMDVGLTEADTYTECPDFVAL
jgi:DNA-binding MarR family transcriptional regulator